METTEPAQPAAWPLWKKIIFRFLFIYLVFQFSPWTWLDAIPGVSFITKYYSQAMDWAVGAANDHLLHVRKVLVPLNGSGDTSYGWAMLWLFLLVAMVGCVIWSVLDRKRANYTILNYWLCLFARYYVALTAFIYGLVKIFAMQMYFPNLHQLATPLGDLLPMRFSWMFIGYSVPYQIFSGVMETVAGLLLLYRRTATLGVFVATGVFINVMMLNLCYDIPVKIFSMQMVFVCLFLIANESERFICFFVLNKPAPVCSVYHFEYPKQWMRIARIVLKILFIVIAIGMQFYSDYDYFTSFHKKPGKQPVKNGVYEVTSFTVNKQNTPLSIADTMRWQDVIFEDGLGSIKTADTTFRQRYKRGYFYYSADSAKHTLKFKKQQGDSLLIMNLNYDFPDTATIRLWGLQRKDSLHVELKRTKRHFQLAERQFHWLSEHNR